MRAEGISLRALGAGVALGPEDAGLSVGSVPLPPLPGGAATHGPPGGWARSGLEAASLTLFAAWIVCHRPPLTPASGVGAQAARAPWLWLSEQGAIAARMTRPPSCGAGLAQAAQPGGQGADSAANRSLNHRLHRCSEQQPHLDDGSVLCRVRHPVPAFGSCRSVWGFMQQFTGMNTVSRVLAQPLLRGPVLGADRLPWT